MFQLLITFLLTHQEVISPLCNALSDHDAQYLILEKFFQTENKNYNNQRNKFKCRLISSETIYYVQDRLAQVTWEDVYSNMDVNNAFSYF
jgi:hypothetical protein